MDDIRHDPQRYEDENEVWIIQRKAEDVIRLLKKGVVNDLSLDHDMGPGELTGYELLCWMEKNNIWPRGNVYVHSANPSGADKMRAVINRYLEKQGEIRSNG